MKIGMIAPLRRNVPPTGHAGTERIIEALVRGLTARGHEVTLFATGDSMAPKPGTLVATWPHEARDLDLKVYNLILANHLLEVARHDGAVDLWSNHVLDFPPALAPLLAAPMVTTVHEAKTDDIAKAAYLANAAKDSKFVAISKRQQELFKPAKLDRVIYNGVDTDALPLGDGSGGYFAWLGWISELKGTAAAVRVAKAAGVPLKIAGMIPERNQEYFDTEIKPHLDGQIEFVGEVLSVEEKAEFLGQAAGLISPLNWEEPFGLVPVEAMACGTPVFTTPRGAMPELVEPGVNGELAEDEAGLAEAVKKAGSFDRQAVRQTVLDRFSIDRMVDDYEGYYQSLIGS